VPYKDPDGNRKWREAQKTGKAYIYWLLEPETRKVRYVGSTLNIKERMRLHWDQRTKRGTQLAQWLCSLEEMPEYEVVQEVDKKFQYEAEEYWTKLLRQVSSVSLLNINNGQKYAVKGFKRPPEVGEKIRLAFQKRREAGITGHSRGHDNHRRGADSPSAKLTDEEARAIKHSTGSLRTVAAQFGVSWITVRNIRLGNTWKHIELHNAGVVYRSAQDPVKISERVQLSSLARMIEMNA